jgi:hypothetical protein
MAAFRLVLKNDLGVVLGADAVADAAKYRA